MINSPFKIKYRNNIYSSDLIQKKNNGKYFVSFKSLRNNLYVIYIFIVSFLFIRYDVKTDEWKKKINDNNNEWNKTNEHLREGK